MQVLTFRLILPSPSASAAAINYNSACCVSCIPETPAGQTSTKHTCLTSAELPSFLCSSSAVMKPSCTLAGVSNQLILSSNRHCKLRAWLESNSLKRRERSLRT